MDLKRQSYRAVQKLYEAVVLSVSQKFFFIIFEQIVEEYIGTLYYRNAIALAEVYRIYRFYFACDPFFRKKVIRSVVVTVRSDENFGILLSAGIYPVNSVAFEKYRLSY